MEGKREKQHTIQVEKKTKFSFEKERDKLKHKEEKLITQDELVNRLLRKWKN